MAAVGLDHGHIYGMANGLDEEGAALKWVYDPDPMKVEAFQKAYPQVKAATSDEEVLADPAVGYPYFGQLILDCLNRTENAMTQEHAFKAAELCITAENVAMRIE